MKKKIISYLILFCLLISELNIMTFATEIQTTTIVDSGTCGAFLAWEYDDEGTLTIGGVGEMYDYLVSGPWYDKEIKKLVIEEGVTGLGERAFELCEITGSVDLPNSLVNIEMEAFFGCSSMTGDLTIPNGVKTIGAGAFSNCLGLDGTVTIPSSVTSLASDAFYNCRGLQKVVNEASVPCQLYEYQDDDYSYYWVEEGAEDVKITSITDGVAVKVKEVKVDNQCGLNLFWDFDEEGTLTISGTGEMYDYLFSGPWYEKDIKNIVFEEGITSIGDRAFELCDVAGTLTLPNSLNVLKMEAFFGCDGLTGDLTIPEGVTTIGPSAFSWCSGFSGTLSIPESVSSIASDAFQGCKGIKRVENNSAVACALEEYREGDYAYYWVKEDAPDTKITSISNGTAIKVQVLEVQSDNQCGQNLFWDLDEEGTLTISGTGEMYDYLFSGPWYGKEIKNLVIEEGVTSIGVRAFELCELSGSLILPESLVEIKSEAFFGCSGLTGELIIPSKVATIGAGAFSNCAGFTGELTIPSGVNTIEGDAFSYCKSISGTLIIPENVTGIGNKAFWGCTGLRKVVNRSQASCGLPDIQLEGYWWIEEEKGVKQIDSISNGTAIFKEVVTEVFNDIKETDWWVNAIQYAYENNVMAGMGESFKPIEELTREQCVQVIYSNSGKPEVDTENHFTDVEDSWYTEAVLWANEQGITSGNGDGSFGVGQDITREQMALMLYKYASLNEYDLTTVQGQINQYADGASVSFYAVEALDWAITQGIISGKGNIGEDISTFRIDPQGTATRAECAAMMMRLLTKNEN